MLEARDGAADWWFTREFLACFAYFHRVCRSVYSIFYSVDFLGCLHMSWSSYYGKLQEIFVFNLNILVHVKDELQFNWNSKRYVIQYSLNRIRINKYSANCRIRHFATLLFDGTPVLGSETQKINLHAENYAKILQFIYNAWILLVFHSFHLNTKKREWFQDISQISVNFLLLNQEIKEPQG